MPELRRYIAVIQDPRGYPPPGQLEPAPPEGPVNVEIVSVVKADEYELAMERLREQNRKHVVWQGELQASIAALKERLRAEVDAGRILLGQASTAYTDDEWESYMSGVVGLGPGVDNQDLAKSIREESRARAIREAASWLRHIDRLDEIAGAKYPGLKFNPLWDASLAMEKALLDV